MLDLVLAAGEVGDVGGQLGRGGHRRRNPGPGRRAGLAGLAGQQIVPGEQAGIELAQLGAGIDAELSGDRLTGLPVCVERFGVAARAVQGLHEQQPQAFPERMIGQQPAQLGDDLSVTAAGQLGLDPQLRSVEAELGQPPGLGFHQHRLRDVSQRGAVPQGERLGEQAGRPLRFTGGVGAPALAHQLLEHSGVGVCGAQPQQVARSAGDQDGAVGVAEKPAQPQHVDADQVG